MTRTIRALELLTQRPQTAVELAEELGVHVRTARRLLNRLVHEGYVTREVGHRSTYSVTLKLISIAGCAIENLNVLRIALKFAREYHARIGQFPQLWVPSFCWVMPLFELESSSGEGRIGITPGRRVPSHCTAPGKALLAHRFYWREAVLQAPLKKYTHETIVDVATLRNNLGQVDALGYAVDRGEYVAALGGVAAPVHDHHGEVIAALGLATAVDALSARTLDNLSQTVVDAARGLSRLLGHDREGTTLSGADYADPLFAMMPGSRSHAA